jgi:agmatinase
MTKHYRPQDSMTTPRIASGPRMFMRLPWIDDPINAEGRIDVAVIGVPTDSAVSYRSGARFGPEAIRSSSILLRDHNPATGVDITKVLSMVDAGDAPVVPGYHELTLQRLEEHLTPFYRAGIVPLLLGGDHSLTMAEMRAMAAAAGPISVIHFDAHGDVLDDYYGVKHFHGTMFRRAVEEGVVDPSRSIQLGMRGSVHPDDVAAGTALGYEVIRWPELAELTPEEVGRRIAARVGDHPVLVSFDIDFLDPAYAPGTGTPEVGGPTSFQTLQYLRALGPLNYWGVDIVEVAPPYDHGDITSHAAAVVAFELLGQLALRRQGRSAPNGRASRMSHSDTSHRNLTMMETVALRGGLNVSDGHPRMALTEGQGAVINRLSMLFDEAVKRPLEDVEAEAQATFLHGIGQLSAPVGTGRLLSCYSSSVAMDLVARTLAERTSRVALVHPTFDNIPDLLRARGLDLVPVTEQEFENGLTELPPDVGAVFVTTPNNPTGWVLPEPALERLARWCAQTSRVLALDACFRAQDPRAQYDSYRVLDRYGVEWVVIEDTGKLWPVLELKAGFLAWGSRTKLPLADAFSDVLLSISPVVLLLITQLALDAAGGGYAQLHNLVRRNREILVRSIEDTPLTLVDSDSRISVARLALPNGSITAEEFYHLLLRRNVHILPCAPFHWARQHECKTYLRVALARNPEEVEQAGRIIAEIARELRGNAA